SLLNLQQPSLGLRCEIPDNSFSSTVCQPENKSVCYFHQYKNASIGTHIPSSIPPPGHNFLPNSFLSSLRPSNSPGYILPLPIAFGHISDEYNNSMDM